MFVIHLHTQWTANYNLTEVTITDPIFVLVLNTSTDTSQYGDSAKHYQKEILKLIMGLLYIT
jgi:hypothetical protein